MIGKRLISGPVSRFGVQTSIRRSKVNVWGTYGYNNFGHDKPDRFPPVTMCFHTFIGLGIILPMLDWERFWPKIEKRYYKIKAAIPFLKSDDDEEAQKQRSFIKFRIKP